MEMIKIVDDNTSAAFSPFSLVEIILILIILNFVIILQDFYSSFRHILQFFQHILSHIRKIWVECRTSIVIFAAWKLGTGKNASNNSPTQFELLRDNIASAEDEGKLSIKEVKMTMEKLMRLDQETLMDSSEIAELFEEEPSLEEVKEAFDLFDENKDGFIDASELWYVLCTLSITEASEAECRRMINAFDDDRDGRISFNEFVKLLEYSYA